jgi:hypothetical protein
MNAPAHRVVSADNGCQVVSGLVRTGTLALVQGYSGHGKTWLALHLADCLTKGRPFLDCHDVAKSSVIYVAVEDASAVRQRLTAAGTRGVALVDGAGFAFGVGEVARTIERLRREVRAVRRQAPNRPVVVVLDTLTAALGNHDPLNDAQMIPLTNALRAFAESEDVALVACWHTNRGNKIEGQGTALEKAAATIILTWIEGTPVRGAASGGGELVRDHFRNLPLPGEPPPETRVEIGVTKRRDGASFVMLGAGVISGNRFAPTEFSTPPEKEVQS